MGTLVDQLIVDLVLIIGGFLGLVICIAASVVDIREYRIPNRLVAIGVVLLLVILSAASLIEHSWQPLLYGVGGGLAFFIAYLALALISPSGMGMGDVKLAAVVGLMLGPLGVTASFVGFYTAFVCGAVFGLTRILLRRGELRSRLPFAPFMTVGATVGLLWPLIAG